ncbi:hypothetical protein A2U01_0092173, partial [Trifolium medium]|nr:hypothetical protein [Trifolium medium]
MRGKCKTEETESISQK